MPSFITAVNSDPLRGFKYQVFLSGNLSFSRMGFQSIKGLKMQTKETEYREGGDNLTTRKLPGITKFPNVTLTRGLIVGDNDIWTWASTVFGVSNFSQPSAGGSFRNNMTINLMNRDGTAARSWTLYNAWVTEYSPGDFDAEKEAIFLNTVIICHEGFNEF